MTNETSDATGMPWTRCNQCGKPEHGSIPCNLVLDGGAAQTPAAGALTWLTTKLVFDKLYEWRSSLWLDEDGEGLPLVDILAPDNEPTIGPAREELWDLADHIAAELTEAAPPQPTAQQAAQVDAERETERLKMLVALDACVEINAHVTGKFLREIRDYIRGRS